MKNKNDQSFLKRFTMIVGLLFVTHLNAGLHHPVLGEIDDHFWVTWNEKSFECCLSLNSDNNLALTVTPLGQASPPQTYVLHKNLIESLSAHLSGELREKYVRYVVAMVASIVVLPNYQYLPNLTLPSYAEVTNDEMAFHIILNAVHSAGVGVASMIDIVEQPSSHNYSVTINGLNEDGLTQSLMVQFLGDWVITNDSDNEVELTLFDEINPYKKRTFLHFWGK